MNGVRDQKREVSKFCMEELWNILCIKRLLSWSSIMDVYPRGSCADEQVKYLLVKVNRNNSIQAHRGNFFEERFMAKKKEKKKKKEKLLTVRPKSLPKLHPQNFTRQERDQRLCQYFHKIFLFRKSLILSFSSFVVVTKEIIRGRKIFSMNLLYITKWK